MLLSSCGVLKDQAVDNIKFQFRMKYFTSAVNMNTGAAVAVRCVDLVEENSIEFYLDSSGREIILRRQLGPT